MVFTINARLGDTVMLLPVASWYAKKYNDTIHFVLSKNGPFNHLLIDLLKYQNFVSEVTLIDIPFDAFGFWEFNPNDYGVECTEYYNFGFWEHPNQTWLPEFYGKRYGFEYDDDYVLQYPVIETPIYENVWVDAVPYRWQAGQVSNFVPDPKHELNQNDSLFYNINVAMNAREIFSCGGGFAALMELALRPCVHIKQAWEIEEGDARVFKEMSRQSKVNHKYIIL